MCTNIYRRTEESWSDKLNPISKRIFLVEIEVYTSYLEYIQSPRISRLLDILELSKFVEICQLVSLFQIRTPSPYNSGGTTPVLRRRTMFMDNNLVLYQEMLRTADKAMQTAIEQMPIGNYK